MCNLKRSVLCELIKLKNSFEVRSHIEQSAKLIRKKGSKMSDIPLVSSSFHGNALRVAVEGNIGSGKTTFLEFCRQYCDIEVVPEPISDWRCVGGTNLLV